jgi:hypothetical protein
MDENLVSSNKVAVSHLEPVGIVRNIPVQASLVPETPDVYLKEALHGIQEVMKELNTDPKVRLELQLVEKSQCLRI